MTEVADFPETVASARRRFPALPDVYYGPVWEQMRAQAFTVSGMTSLFQIDAVLEELNTAIEGGGTFADFKKNMASLFDAGEVPDLPRHRLELIFRNHVQQAYQRGHWKRFEQTKGLRPFLRYSATQDSRTRPAHAAFHGAILPVDDPFWRTHAPPNGHNCRCQIQSLSERQAERLGGVTERPRQGVDPGWEHHPEGANKQERDRALSKLGSCRTPGNATGALPYNIACHPGAAEQLRGLADSTDGDTLDRLLSEYLFEDEIEELAGIADDAGMFGRALSRAEVLSVLAYTTDAFVDANALLRRAQGVQGELTARQRASVGVVAGVLDAWDKLPSYTAPVSRYVDPKPISGDWIEAHRPGQFVRYRGFTSTSQGLPENPSSETDYFNQYIVPSNARDISEFSSMPEGREVLIRPGSVFRVEAVDGRDMMLVQVDEADIPAGSRIHEFGATYD